MQTNELFSHLHVRGRVVQGHVTSLLTNKNAQKAKSFSPPSSSKWGLVTGFDHNYKSKASHHSMKKNLQITSVLSKNFVNIAFFSFANNCNGNVTIVVGEQQDVWLFITLFQ